MAKGSSAASVLGGEKKKSKGGKKHVHEMSIRRGHSGGYIVKHHHEADPETGAQQPSEEHVVGDASALQQHVADNMGDQPQAEAAVGDPAAQDPSAAAAPPQGAPVPVGG